jgi:hypothetical protein
MAKWIKGQTTVNKTIDWRRNIEAAMRTHSKKGVSSNAPEGSAVPDQLVTSAVLSEWRINVEAKVVYATDCTKYII